MGTIMDYYLLVGFVALILMIAENAIVGIPALDDAGAEIDLWCAIIFGAMWMIVHVIALIALLRKECLRVSWEEMDRIDGEEDEEAEFIFAEMTHVQGQEESAKSKSEWEKYKAMDVMERANLYAKDNNIKRSGTFMKKIDRHRKKTAADLDKAYDKALEDEEKRMNSSATSAGEEKVEVYVPSKLDKVMSASQSDEVEDKMATQIELQEKEQDDEEELIKKDAQHEHNATVLVKEDEEDETEKEDYVQVDKDDADQQPAYEE